VQSTEESQVPEHHENDEHQAAGGRDRYARTPIPPLSQDRALMVKYTHTLVW
jgi:hypothetical protein